jgi:hypothetical protein
MLHNHKTELYSTHFILRKVSYVPLPKFWRRSYILSHTICYRIYRVTLSQSTRLWFHFSRDSYSSLKLVRLFRNSFCFVYKRNEPRTCTCITLLNTPRSSNIRTHSAVLFPIHFSFSCVCVCGVITPDKCLPCVMYGRQTLSLQQAVEAYRVVRRRSSHIF